jgi:hypothetical protein
MTELTKVYLEQFGNKALRTRLVNVDLIPDLERTLCGERDKFLELKRLKRSGDISFNRKPNTGELSDLLAQVAPIVDDFLGVKGIPSPEIEYFDIYGSSMEAVALRALYIKSLFIGAVGSGLSCLLDSNYPLLINLVGLIPVYKSISAHLRTRTSSWLSGDKPFLENTKRELIIPAIGHEYAHYAVNCVSPKVEGGLIAGTSYLGNPLLFTAKYKRLQEAIAIAVERYISNSFADSTRNQAYLYGVQERLAGELKSAYIHVCEELREDGVELKPELIRFRTGRDKVEKRYRKIKGFPTPHAIGGVLFLLEEQKQEPGIYQRLLNGAFTFAA